MAKEWGALGSLAGLLVILLALVVLVCTAMIYACLKTIPRWHNWQTIVSYPLFGLMSGALLLMALMPGSGAVALRWVAMVSLVVAAAVKLSYQIRFDKPAGITLGDAIKQSWGTPKLLDVGHTHASFLTREFGYELAASHAVILKLMMWLLAFALPLLIIVLAPGLAWLAAICCIAGVAVERWLFFAQAKHVVRLYHGAQQV
jgi:DMSO reductase anchor subunit